MFASIVTDLTDWLDRVSEHWWFLLIIFVIAYLDSVVPIVPSETCVIIGGIAAGQGHYPLAVVIACGATGAFLGDNTAYTIGSWAGPWFERRAERKPKTRARLDWGKQQIRTRGGLLLITARFIPGGRTMLTLASGITHQPRRWFVSWILVAAVIWATYASLLGYAGGRAFKDNHTAAFGVAFGAAVSITVLIEVVRFLRQRRHPELRHP
ncbi:MAG: DedA family protein [Acidimicrobiia bacterium]